MVLKLYYEDISSPARSVLLTAKALGLNMEMISLSLLDGEHKSNKFTKINPQNTVPAIDDNGFILWESHAILTYLADKYGKDDSLYPKDLQKRAVINQRLHYNGAVVQPRMRPILRALYLGLINEVPTDKFGDVYDTYEVLEKFIGNNPYMAGENLTLADLSLVASVSSLELIVTIDSTKYPKLSKWLSLMKTLPYYKEANQVGLDKYFKVIKSRLSS